MNTFCRDRACKTRLTWLLVLNALFLLSPLAARLPAAVFTSNTIISETDTTYDGQDIVIDGSGFTVTMDGAHNFNSLFLTNGAMLTHSPCTATVTHKLDLRITNAI